MQRAVKNSERRRIFIKEWRKHRLLTQEQLAERVGMSAAQLSRVESGAQQYTQDLLEALAVALNATPADLLMRDPGAPESIYSIWDQVPPERRAEAVAVMRIFAQRTGTDG